MVLDPDPMHPAVLQSQFIRRPAAIAPFLWLSIAGHALLMTLIVAHGYLARGPTLDLEQKPIRATLVRKGKPRDERLLPRKEELPPPPRESIQNQAATASPPVFDRAVAVPLAATKPSEKKSSRQEGAKDAARRRELMGMWDKASKATKLDELQGQEDGDPLGDSAHQEGERYWGILTAQVRRHYELPKTLSDQERLQLKANVILWIGKAGELVRAELSKSSGNALFDNAVVLATKHASPFSPPPEHLRESLQRVGVELGFSP